MYRDSVDIEERKLTFQTVWRIRFVNDVSRTPTHLQGPVHEMLKRAFNAGTTWERRNSEPVEVGGNDCE